MAGSHRMSLSGISAGIFNKARAGEAEGVTWKFKSGGMHTKNEHTPDSRAKILLGNTSDWA